MYISGQLGMDPASGQLVEGGVQAQTRQVIHEKKNMPSHQRNKTDKKTITCGSSSCRLLWIWAKSLKLLGAVMRMVKKNLIMIIWPGHFKVASSSPSPLWLFPAVVKATVLLADINDFNAVNDIYKQCKCHYFYIILFSWPAQTKPGNSVIQVPISCTCNSCH